MGICWYFNVIEINAAWYRWSTSIQQQLSPNPLYISPLLFCLIHPDDGAYNIWWNIGTPLAYDAATQITRYTPSIYVLPTMWDTVSHPHKQQVGETSVKQRSRARRWFRAILLSMLFSNKLCVCYMGISAFVFTLRVCLCHATSLCCEKPSFKYSCVRYDIVCWRFSTRPNLIKQLKITINNVVKLGWPHFFSHPLTKISVSNKAQSPPKENVCIRTIVTFWLQM